MSVERCHECGNILQKGSCSRCEANNFARQRRWRRGDRGGKRPERRRAERQLRDALDGTWKNKRKQVTVYIDTEQGTYRSVQHTRGQDTNHTFRFQKESDGTIYFFKGELPIEAFISDLGFLVMRTGEKRMSFAYEFDEVLFLTCPICFGKSPIEYTECKYCDWEFEQYSQT
ncbi:MAG: hypothetical protein KJ069_11805 [Anaerolineae bacterium]|nr:hypothetical protein [Anaerolineae bacterium]